jgi:hypothetical protein
MKVKTKRPLTSSLYQVPFDKLELKAMALTKKERSKNVKIKSMNKTR